ncbi:MAG: Mur ligase family protein [Synergistaceae bacterium]|nr:Mur ligase family protein [Synergistaceae bacterium]
MNKKAGIRIAVTGSRGKSSIVRMLHEAFCCCEVNCRSRITGVIPRELSPYGENPILRSAGANVAELKWWLSMLPDDTEAVITENSAISPELQSVCPNLLLPTLTVLTNINPDHTALWGNDEESVLNAISGALPIKGSVILPRRLAERTDLLLLADRKKLTLYPVEENKEFKSHFAINIPLALKACELSGLNIEKALYAIKRLKPDIADSCLIKVGNAELAFAFSINDLQSTKDYFYSLKWIPGETTLIYNHRRDRWDRLKAFDEWISQAGWKKVCIIGDLPFLPRLFKYYKKVETFESMTDMITKAGRCFGCGNTVYGLPLAFKLALEDGTLKI